MISPEYLAGLIDGEGYLGLLPSRAKGLKNPSYEPVIKIGMTGESILVIFKLLQTVYGGNIEKRKELTKGDREAYTYTLKSKKKVLDLLRDIHEHLIVKSKQSELLMIFCMLPSSHTRYKSYSEEDVRLKDEIYFKLKELKKPEPPATTK